MKTREEVIDYIKEHCFGVDASKPNSTEWEQTFYAAIQYLKNPHGWIPTKKELPKDGERVVCSGSCGAVYMAYYNHPKHPESPGWWRTGTRNHYFEPVAWSRDIKPYKKR